LLGSTADALGDAAGKAIENTEKWEKLKMIKKAERSEKDKATIRYNFSDFLKQSENLTDQCTTLVETLSCGTQECVICSNPIYQKSALWNCRQCCQPFHLGCIKRWIKKLNKKYKDGEDQNEEEEKVPEQEQMRNIEEELEEIADSAYEQEGKRAAKIM